MQAATLRAASASQGRWLVMPMWGTTPATTSDWCAAPKLLEDIATDRAWVRQAVQQLSDIQITVFNRLWELVDGAITGIEGSVNYVSCWSQERTMAFDCDLSCLFLPVISKSFLRRPLLQTMSTVKHRIFHLDGVVALQHLKTLQGPPSCTPSNGCPGRGEKKYPNGFP